MKRVLLSAGIAVVIGMAARMPRGMRRPARQRQRACAGCHGANGEGIAPNPALAGKSEEVLVAALKDFKSGKRDNAIMKGMTAALTDGDVANLAAYFASLKAK